MATVIPFTLAFKCREKEVKLFLKRPSFAVILLNE